MKIRLPTTLAEPLTLQWNKIIRLSVRDEIAFILKIQGSLDELCADLNESAMFDKLTHDDFLFLLKRTSKKAGGIRVGGTYKQFEDGRAYHAGMRYDISFKISKHSVRQSWYLEVSDKK